MVQGYIDRAYDRLDELRARKSKYLYVQTPYGAQVRHKCTREIGIIKLLIRLMEKKPLGAESVDTLEALLSPMVRRKEYDGI